MALARLNSRGYFSGLSSPSVTLSRATLASSPQSNSTGQTRLPTFSMNRMSTPSRSRLSMAVMIMLLSRWQPPSVLICTAWAPVAATRRASLSVCRSPSMTAMRNSPARSCRVRSSRVVLPAPGDEIRFRARILRSRSFSRTLAAIFSLASRTLRTTGICIVSSRNSGPFPQGPPGGSMAAGRRFMNPGPR